MVALLKSYPVKKRQIEQLHYEKGHLPQISDHDMIESLSLGAPIISGGKSGHISDKTVKTAMQYQDAAQKLNSETADQIEGELQALIQETERLDYYLSLLSDRQANILRLLYIDGRLWSEVEAELHLSRGTLNSERHKALESLASMYSFIESVSMNGFGETGV